MAWHRPGEKPLSEPMMVSLLTHIYASLGLNELKPVWTTYGICTIIHRVTLICVSKLTIIVSDNGLLPGWHQVIIWTKPRILLIGPLRTNFNEILIGIHTSSFKKIHFKMSFGKWRPFCLGLNVLMNWLVSTSINVYFSIPNLYHDGTTHRLFKLTHWGQNKVAPMLQMTFSNAFWYKEIVLFWLKFHGSMCWTYHNLISEPIMA